ncbi:MAG: DUF1566 domain-containing protein [Proteobacteria bacterium]|nr:DUF1566 domain-containing protein [Pseudomonadota bacterium]MBU1714066.1 DUF1566 domain-containing protein [Pseudomonadota bacterium]
MKRKLFLGVSAVVLSLLLSLPAVAGDYVVKNDLILTSNLTGLVWQRVDDNITRDWKAAKDYCLNLSYAGYDDWRLPNHYELRTILNEGDKYPAITQDLFPKTKSARYWTGTELPYYDQMSFYVNFGDDSSVKSSDDRLVAMQWKNKYYCRCVRGKRKKIQKK